MPRKDLYIWSFYLIKENMDFEVSRYFVWSVKTSPNAQTIHNVFDPKTHFLSDENEVSRYFVWSIKMRVKRKRAQRKKMSKGLKKIVM